MKISGSRFWWARSFPSLPFAFFPVRIEASAASKVVLLARRGKAPFPSFGLECFACVHAGFEYPRSGTWGLFKIAG